MPQPDKPAADLFERPGRALAGDALDWQMHVAEWLGVRRDTVRDWRSGRVGPRPEGWADLLALLEHRQKGVRGVEQELREWLPRPPKKDSQEGGNHGRPARPPRGAAGGG